MFVLGFSSLTLVFDTYWGSCIITKVLQKDYKKNLESGLSSDEEKW